MLAIKFKRIGKKRQSAFRIVVMEKKSKMSGRYVEDLGFWNPKTNLFNVNKERAQYWIKNGAQPTDSVHNLLIKSLAVAGKKIPVHKTAVKEATTQEVQEASSVLAEQQPSAETEPQQFVPVEESAPQENAQQVS